MPSDIGMPDYDDLDYPVLTEDDLDLSAAEGIPDDEENKSKKKRDPRSELPGGPSKLGEAGGEEGGSGGKRKKRKRYSPDDIGNAERLLDEFGEEMRWDDSLKEWTIWKGVRWEVDSHEALRRAMSIPKKILAQAGDILMYDPEDKTGKALDNWGRQCGNIGRLKAMLETARSMTGVSVPSEHFNQDRRLLACPNGTLVLGREGSEFRATRREDLTTKVAGCSYDPGARSPMFDDFLDKFLPDIELRNWAQKVAGYSMLGGNPKRRIVFCWGPTSSGKSTFAELVKEAMGSYAGTFNLSMLRENQDERPRPDLVVAINQRAIFASEASADWHLHADMIKRATGQDELLARLPHSGVPISKVPDFTPWIITNNIPTINGADQALYRRLCTVLFPNSIADEVENESFKQDLIERGELPGILAWLVEGWNMYCEDGLSNPPHKVVTAEMKMREQFSDVDVFISECCEKGTGMEYKAIPSDLYSAYEDWAEENGVKGRDRLTNTAFGRALTGRGFPSKVLKEDGKTLRRRLGLRLKVK